MLNKYENLLDEYLGIIDILEVMNCETEARKLALMEIHDMAEHHEDSIERLGNSMWLKDWYKKHPEDLELF